MAEKPLSPDAYLDSLSDERREVMSKLRHTLQKHLPPGFEETIQYNMLAYVVPHSLYPAGYHTDPKQALPFIHLAAQKRHIALYHLGLYTNDALLNWFVQEYARHARTQLDMGKSCIRFKKMDDIPYDLIAELAGKMSPQDWIAQYAAMRRG
jgi:hypothetical protein